jgi:hypothetical protein
LFAKMLTDFLYLCKTWLMSIMPEQAIVYNRNWPLSAYINTLETLFNPIL